MIGQECFMQWTTRMPGLCPYWSHPLPTTVFARQPDENSHVTVLRWLATSRWMNMLEVINVALIFDLTPGHEIATIVAAWEVLAQGTLKDSQAYFLHHYYIEYCINTFVILPMLVFTVPLLLVVVLVQILLLPL
jgi:hypothetical protein